MCYRVKTQEKGIEEMYTTDITELDIGYGWTKGKRGQTYFCEPSILGNVKRLHEENRKEGYIISDDYFVGELALKHSDIKYYSLKDSKANTWTTEILMKTALAYLKANDTNIVTGLPVDFYFNQIDDFRTLIDRIHGSDIWIEVLGTERRREVLNIRNHKIVPQPLGAAMDYLLDDNGDLEKKEEARKRILVVDWGRYTLDLLVLDGMEIHKLSCSPPDMGIESAYKILGRYLRDHIGKSPAGYEMDKLTRIGEYEGKDIKPLIDAAFKTAIQQIQLEIEGLNMHFHKYLLVGGQASRLDEHLNLPEKIVGHQLSNLNGYGKIGKRTWQKNAI